jgi:TPP-dependent pyruvate/acetoin dehydrogenase alpha subunit
MPHSPADLEDLYSRVLLVRLCEQQIMKEYFQDEMKTPVHLGIGGEAIATGVHFACPKDTQYFGTYRNHALYLACSGDTDGFFGEMYGKINGCGKGKAGSMHMSIPESGLIATSAVVGTTIPVAAGAALTAQYTNSGKMVVCIFGDGAVEEGVFFETLNFASLKKLPILFVCEDNELAIHSLRHERKGFEFFSEVAKTFNLEYGEGDGSMATDVVSKTSDIVARMKKSNKPGFLHFNYFRFLEHVGPLEDFDKGYREKPSDMIEKWDPVPKLLKDCVAAGVKADRLAKIEADILGRIAASVAKAKAASFPPPRELFADVFAPNVGGTH